MFNLTEKIAIVTGASRGIGQSMAVGLAEAGAKVVCVATKEMVKTQELIEKIGGQCHFVPADLSNYKEADRIVKETVAKYEKVDILVNNAGIIRRQPCLEFSIENWDEVMNINLRSAFFLSQAVAKQFVKQQTGGKIINTASLLSFQGGILVPSYTASKSALAGITKTMCNEWAPYNINVNAIAPGYIETDVTTALRKDKNRNKTIIERIPAGRWGKPDDLKGAAVFLASSASNYINGHILVVDGGWMAR